MVALAWEVGGYWGLHDRHVPISIPNAGLLTSPYRLALCPAAGVMQEAERTGDKWWRAPGRNLAKEVGAQWTRMSPEERRPYEEQATNEQ